MLIGLDLDGVCYNWDKTARYMLRKRYVNSGRVIPIELTTESRSWDYIMEAVTPDDWKWLWSEAIDQGLYRYGNVVKGAIEGVQELNELGDVIVITHRPKTAVHDTLVWLSTMFDKAPLSGLVIQSHKGQRKSDVRPQPDVYIDDAIHNAEDILENTDKRIIVYDQPWNQSGPVSHKRLARAYGWSEVVKYTGMVREMCNG